MDLSYDDVQRILQIVDSSSLEEVHIEIGDLKLVVRKRGPGERAPSPSAEPGTVARVEPAPAPRQGVPISVASAAAASAALTAKSNGAIEIRAPMVGTFYRAPAPGAPAFVEVGSKVDAEDVVCIIEVMKLLNSIRAGRRGQVVEILAENGKLVEYGQPLIVIKPVD